ncbi:ABC transporter ATP-binding protein [Natrarchaeobius sp. A-rgal3]|uniref:ABC transporter ATP-binding protein n=1 Tax=Natrarchaeobius versutus TaxID=1679078 RepID=UPI00350FD706
MGKVRIDTVRKQYSDVVAVDDLSVEIENGEFVTLVGPSGCGKSTTLEMISGLTTPTEGEIHIAGSDVTDAAPKDRDIAMVFQNIALFPHLDVFDNISYGLQIRGHDRTVIEEKVQEAVEILQLEGMLDRMPSELSGGQRQRVGIGRALVRDPSVFLMDEPLANLDAKLRVHMRTEIQRIQRELDVTTIYVTHDQEEAMTMSDRIAIMNDGELQQIAPPLTCYNRPANVFVASFIGSPSMNRFPGSVDDQSIACPTLPPPIDVSGVSSVSSGDPVTVGIRPEDVYLADGDDQLAYPSRRIEATVDVIEPLGDELLVYMLFEDGDGSVQMSEEGASETSEQLLMKADPDVSLTEGDRVAVTFDRSALHVFDGAGEAVAHGVETTADDSTPSPATAKD